MIIIISAAKLVTAAAAAATAGSLSLSVSVFIESLLEMLWSMCRARAVTKPRDVEGEKTVVII